MNIQYVALFSVLAVCTMSPMANRADTPLPMILGFPRDIEVGIVQLYQADDDFERGVANGCFDMLVEYMSQNDERNFTRSLQGLPHINFQAGYLQRTLAHVCAATKAKRFLQLIHNYGPDYNVQDFAGNTPLMIALEAGYPDEVEFLLPHSDLTMKNNAGHTVVELARSALIMRGADAQTRVAWQLLQDFRIYQLEQELAESAAREATVRAAFREVSTRKTESKKRKREEFIAACYVCCTHKQEDGSLLKVTNHPCSGQKHDELLCRECFDRLAQESQPCPLCKSSLKKVKKVSWRTLKPDASGPVHKKLKIVLKTRDLSSSSSSSSSSDSDSQ